MLESLDEFYRQSLEVFVIIWVADQDRIYGSAYSKELWNGLACHWCNTSLIRSIFGRLGNGQNQDAIFK